MINEYENLHPPCNIANHLLLERIRSFLSDTRITNRRIVVNIVGQEFALLLFIQLKQ